MVGDHHLVLSAQSIPSRRLVQLVPLVPFHPSVPSVRSHQLVPSAQSLQSVLYLHSIRLFHPAPVGPGSAAGRASATRERSENRCRNATYSGHLIGTACRSPVAYDPQPAPSAGASRRPRRARASHDATSSRLCLSCRPSCRPSGPASWQPSCRRGSCPIVRRQHWRGLPAALPTGSPGPATVVSPRCRRHPRPCLAFPTMWPPHGTSAGGHAVPPTVSETSSSLCAARRSFASIESRISRTASESPAYHLSRIVTVYGDA